MTPAATREREAPGTPVPQVPRYPEKGTKPVPSWVPGPTLSSSAFAHCRALPDLCSEHYSGSHLGLGSSPGGDCVHITGGGVLKPWGPALPGTQPSLSSNAPRSQCYIDGPYGTPTRRIFASEHAVLIGAGIGITPFASILQSIVHRRVERLPALPAPWGRVPRSPPSPFLPFLLLLSFHPFFSFLPCPASFSLLAPCHPAPCPHPLHYSLD